jgi:hypothetical protein
MGKENFNWFALGFVLSAMVLWTGAYFRGERTPLDLFDSPRELPPPRIVQPDSVPAEGKDTMTWL